jgi:hypothetical protein
MNNEFWVNGATYAILSDAVFHSLSTYRSLTGGLRENDISKQFCSGTDITAIAEPRPPSVMPSKAGAWMNAAVGAYATISIDHDRSPMGNGKTMAEYVWRYRKPQLHTETLKPVSKQSCI